LRKSSRYCWPPPSPHGGNNDLPRGYKQILYGF
jgi:hypothetical protein